MLPFIHFNFIHTRAPSLDSGMETQEPEIETSTSQDVHTGPPQLRLPTVPGSSGGPPVAPKPGTPLWLKKMVDWQNAEKEKEHGEYGRMKEKVEHLSRANQVSSLYATFILGIHRGVEGQ